MASRHGRKEKKQGRGLLVFLVVLVLAVIAVAVLFGERLKGWIEAIDGGQVFRVRISEIGSANDSYPNEDGIFADYIELYNPGDAEVSLKGYKLTDGGRNNLYEFPDDAVIGPRAYKVVWCSKSAEGPWYAPFGLARAGGEDVRLLDPAENVIQSVDTVAVESNQSMLIGEDGTVKLTDEPSPGRENGEPVIHPTEPAGEEEIRVSECPVRLNEFMSSNTALPSKDGNFYDWVELYNPSSVEEDLSGFTLSDGTDSEKYTFPYGSVIGADSYLVMECVKDGELGFSLSRTGGETLTLKDREGLTVDAVDTPAMEKNQVCARTDSGWKVLDFATPGYENSEAGRQAREADMARELPAVTITEMMAVNGATLPDKDGEFSDWIEIVNSGAEPADLTGWYLSDDPKNPYRWAFGETKLEAGARLVIFCSGKDRKDGEHHTNFSLAAANETVSLTSPEGYTVDSMGYSVLEKDYVVTKNGVSDTPTPGYPETEDGYDAFCRSRTAPELAIWEVMNANGKYLPQSDGKCYDWAEIKNCSDHEIELSEFCLTDGSGTVFPLPERKLPAGEYTVLILSGDDTLTGKYTHLGFTLSAEGDSLILTDRDGKAADWVRVPKLPSGTSYGRTDAAGGFRYMDPTPGKENGEGTRKVSAVPKANLKEGVTVSKDPVTLSFTSAGKVYYTLDGSVPEETDNLYTGPLQIDQNTVVRAVQKEPGKRIGEPFTATILIGEEHSLPVVCLTADPADLFGSGGIYKSYVSVKEIEKPANLAYTAGDGSFALDCGMKLHGVTSIVNMEKKSFAIKFRGAYGGKLNYDIFGDGKITSFGSLLLRADQESVYSSCLRDNLFGRIGSTSYEGTMQTQNTRPAVLYINGKYWGIYSIREQYNEEYYAAHTGCDEKTVTVAKEASEGTLKDFRNMCSGRLSDEKYEKALTMIDPVSFADWIVFEAYCGNTDVMGNTRYIMSTEDNLWRWALVDVDLGFYSKESFTKVTYGSDFGRMSRAVLKTPAFRKLFLERAQYLLTGPLSDKNVLETLDSLADEIRSEIPADRKRWGGTPEHWETMLGELRKYCKGRAVKLVKDMRGAVALTEDEKETYFANVVKEE